MIGSIVKRGLVSIVVMLASASSLRAEPITYRLDFDAPMSWGDDAVVWGMGGTQKWEVQQVEDRSVLRISGKDTNMVATNEMRTLQINHEPGASATISFDLRAIHVPPGATIVLRHFDGYCTGGAFRDIAGEEFAPFPKPLFSATNDKNGDAWRHVEVSTGPLKQTVLTLAFHVWQYPAQDKEKPPGFVEFHLDNLQIKTEALSQLRDPGFDWHGVQGGTKNFKASIAGKSADWCDFADQEDVRTPNGGTIHFTLMQFRDTASQKGSLAKHNINHMVSHDGVGGRSVIALSRESSGGFNAASWGVRQTVAYTALGFKVGETGKIRATMRVANDDDRLLGTSHVQLGIDPKGGIVTKQATWSEEFRDNIVKEGWRTVKLTFDRPADATAFTVFFRHRDGVPQGPEFQSNLPEPQSMGSRFGSTGLADWVLIEKVP